MREVDGRLICADIPELVDPAHTALLLIDIQSDFCKPGGTFDSHGYDVSMYREMIRRTTRLLDQARSAGVLCVFVQNTTLQGHRSDSPAQVRFWVRLSWDDPPSLQYTEDCTRGHEFVAELTPRADELVVKKFRSSAFVGTPMDLLLRSNGIHTIVISGCTTEGCVESTARDGMFMDYYVVVPDCVESDTRDRRQASMTLMRARFNMVRSDEIIGIWRNAGRS